MEFYVGDLVKQTSGDGEGLVVNVDKTNQTIKVSWKYGATSAWTPSRYFRIVERGQEYVNSLKNGEEVLVRAVHPEAIVIGTYENQVKVMLKSNGVECWYPATNVERPKKKTELPNTVGSQVIVHKHVWTLLPKYLTWLNGTYIPGVVEEDLLWIYTPNNDEQSLEYIKQPDISRFTWTLIRDAGLDK